MIGNAPEMQKIRDIIEKIAPTEARVLITGENGTGKELVAAQYINKVKDIKFQ